MSLTDPLQLSSEVAVRFQALQDSAKQLSAQGHLIEALEKLESAKAICATSKVQKRILKVKEYLDNYVSNTSTSENKPLSSVESDKFNRLKAEGKKLAEEGCFKEALLKLQEAQEICKTPKIQKWIKKLEIYLQDQPTAVQTEPEVKRGPAKSESDLSPKKFEQFKKFQQSAMKLSFKGNFKEALENFKQALQICESPEIEQYIVDLRKMSLEHAEKLANFQNLTESGHKLIKEGKKMEALKILRQAYQTCPSPSVEKMISSLEAEDFKKPFPVSNMDSDSVKRSLQFSAADRVDVEPSMLFSNSNVTATEITPNKTIERETVVSVSDGFAKKSNLSPIDHKEENHAAFGNQDSCSGIVQQSTPIKSPLTKKTTAVPETPSDLSPRQLAKFKSIQEEAKAFAAEGKLKESLALFYDAKMILQTPKLLKRIKTLEDHIKASLDEQSGVDEDEMVEIATGFKVYREIFKKLYSYQREGVAWMWGLHKRKKGGVLGDDMGLGKTFQVIAFLSGVIDADLVKTILIIMPVSLLENWKREFNRWCPGISVYEFHGKSKKEHERNLNRVQRRGNVLLTSYGMVISNLEVLTHIEGRQFIWDYVILDEGHKIKNPTKTTKAVHDIPSRNRIVLTGTPVQNNLRELWALYDFCHQGTLLGSLKTFKMQYESIITRSREKDSTAGEKRLGTEMAENLKRIIQPYFLRRTKGEVLSTKPDNNVDYLGQQLNGLSISKPMSLNSRKNDLIVWLKMTDAQFQIYSSFLESDVVKTILMTKKSPLVQLTVLKKICDHPRLLSQKACQQLGLDGEISEEELQAEIDDESTSTSSIENVSDETLIRESVKLRFLIELLENLHSNGHRTLVFSLSRKILDMVQRILINKKWKVMRLDGTITKMEEREKRIQLFQRDSSFPVFLLTTQVGGVGITLTAADRVVIYDPSWNPATDAQAVDRVYRIGQQKNVVIYRLITCASVEEKIYRRQIFKDSITRQATTAADPHRYFSKQELRELFSIENHHYSATQVQLAEMHSSERNTDTSLDEHIAFLHSLDIFGISDHDLMFTKEIHDETEDNCQNAVSHDYIKKTVEAAQQIIQAEASVVEEGIRLAGSYARPYLEPIPLTKKNSDKDKYKPPVFPEIIDLTNMNIVNTDIVREVAKKVSLSSVQDVFVTPPEYSKYEITSYSPSNDKPNSMGRLSRGFLGPLENITINITSSPKNNCSINEAEAKHLQSLVASEQNASHLNTGIDVDISNQSTVKIDTVDSPKPQSNKFQTPKKEFHGHQGNKIQTSPLVDKSMDPEEKVQKYFESMTEGERLGSADSHLDIGNESGDFSSDRSTVKIGNRVSISEHGDASVVLSKAVFDGFPSCKDEKDLPDMKSLDEMFPLSCMDEDDFPKRTQRASSRRKSCAVRPSTVVTISDSDSSSQQSYPTSANNSAEIIASNSDSGQESEVNDSSDDNNDDDASTASEQDLFATSMAQSCVDESASSTNASINASDRSFANTIEGSPYSSSTPRKNDSEQPRVPRTPDTSIKRITPLRVDRSYRSPRPSPFEVALNNSSILDRRANANLLTQNLHQSQDEEESPLHRNVRLKFRKNVISSDEDSD